ncbi:MAG: hypothetical protein ACT4OE_09715 [Sphingosinicella sp.]
MARAEEKQGRAERRPLMLKPLAGRWLRLYVLAWLLLLPLAVAMPVYGTIADMRRAESPVWAPVGVWITIDRGEVVVAAVASAEARAAGIVQGDAITGIDELAVSGEDSLAAAEARLAAGEGTGFDFSLRGRDGREKRARLTRRAAHIDEAFAGSGLTIGILDIVAWTGWLLPVLFFVPASLLLFRQRREPVAASLSLAFLLIAAGDLGLNGWLAIGASSLAAAAVAQAGVAALVLVLLTFPSGRFVPAGSVWMVPLLFLWWAISLSDRLPNLVNGAAMVGFLAAGTAMLVLRYRRMGPGDARQQTRWALFGFAAGTLAVGLAYIAALLADTLFAGNIRAGAWLEVGYNVLLPLGWILFAAGLLVSLLHYRLYDVEALISRSAGYAILTLAFAVTFAISAKIVTLLIETEVGQRAGAWPGIIGGVLATMTIAPFNDRFRGWAERRFQKALVHLKRDLPRRLDDLRETEGLEPLLEALLRGAAAGARASHGAVVIDGKPAATLAIAPAQVRAWLRGSTLPATGALERDRKDPMFPMRLAIRTRYDEDLPPTAWLLLGPRPDGSFQGKDEIEALTDIADAAARAIRIVRRRAERWRTIGARLDRLERPRPRTGRSR